jgi:hypothetical protein
MHPAGWAAGNTLAETCREDPSKAVVVALEKFIKASKQLVAVAKGINKKAVPEMVAGQMAALQSELSEQTTQLNEDRNAAKSTTNKDYVKSLVNRTSHLSTMSGSLCKLCEQATTDTQQVLLYKSIGLAATTLRDALLLMVDTLAEVPIDWQDPQSEAMYYGAAKVVEKALTHLLNSKAVALGDNVIPRGELAEVTASCCASVGALTKIVYAFEEVSKCPTPFEFLTRVRLAAIAVGQLQAAMNAAIAKSDLGISHGLLKDSLTEALDQVKSSFAAMVQQSKKVMAALEPDRIDDVAKLIEKPRDAIAHLLSCVINLSEVNISEVKNVACKPLAGDVEAAQKMLQAAMPDRPAQRPEEETAKEYLDGGNVWDDGPDTEENTSVSDGKLKAASFNKIIEKMTSHDAERDMLLKTFVLTHPSVTTAYAFIDKLLQRFEVPSEKAIEKTAVQARVCNTLLVWLTNHFEDLPVDVVEQVERLTETLRGDPALKGWATRVVSLINRKRQEQAEEDDRQYAPTAADLDHVSLDASSSMHPSKILIVFTEEDIAKQLTLIDFGVYSKIRSTELLDQAWSKPKYKYRARNIARLIARSNDLTLWVCSLVVWPKTLKERVRALTKIVEIACGLQKLNNFNSLVSFMSALNNSAVHRLKHTFEGLSEESARQLAELKEATKVDGNHKRYRAALTRCDGPCIPFIGVTLTDITFMDDAASSFGRGGLVNVSKFEKLHGMVSEVLSFQQEPFDITPNEQLISLLMELPHNSEDELFKLSLLREPRGAEKSALA